MTYNSQLYRTYRSLFTHTDLLLVSLLPPPHIDHNLVLRVSDTVHYYNLIRTVHNVHYKFLKLLPYSHWCPLRPWKQNKSQYAVSTSTTGTKQTGSVGKWDQLVVCLCNCMAISFTAFPFFLRGDTSQIQVSQSCLCLQAKSRAPNLWTWTCYLSYP